MAQNIFVVDLSPANFTNPSLTLWEFMISKFAVRQVRDQTDNLTDLVINLGTVFYNEVYAAQINTHNWVNNSRAVSLHFTWFMYNKFDLCLRTTYEETNVFHPLSISEILPIARAAHIEALPYYQEAARRYAAAEESRRYAAAEENRRRLAAEEAASPALNTWTQEDLQNNDHMDCGVCFGTVEKLETTRTTCGHVFCTSCLQEWLKRSRTCPLCRNSI
jgi:hypothetical protein